MTDDLVFLSTFWHFDDTGVKGQIGGGSGNVAIIGIAHIIGAVAVVADCCGATATLMSRRRTARRMLRPGLRRLLVLRAT